MVSTIVRANGVDLHINRYRTGSAGERPVVVFVHGLTVDQSVLGFVLGMPMAATAEVVLYDLRGHGRSQAVPTGYRVTDHVMDLFALLDLLGVVTPVHLVAYSYGGAVASGAALSCPDRVASMTLIEGLVPYPGWGEEIASMLADIAEGSPEQRDRLEAGGGHRLAAGRRLGGIVGRARRLACDTTLLEDLRAEPGITDDDLRQIACPVLAVYGAESEFEPISRRLRAVLPNAEVHTFADARHFDILTRTRVLRTLVRDFVQRPDLLVHTPLRGSR